MNINKKGILTLDTSSNYIVDNFTETRNLNQWSVPSENSNPRSHLDDNGILILEGVNPGVSTKNTFKVNPTDILCFEFTISVPIPSTFTSDPGPHVGITYGQRTYVYKFNSLNQWELQRDPNNNDINTNPYFLSAYNKTDELTLRNYIIGSEVSIDEVPFGYTTNNSYPAKTIKLINNTTTSLRTGYNSNSAMEIHFSNPKLYNIRQHGIYEENNLMKLGNNWINTNCFYEY